MPWQICYRQSYLYHFLCHLASAGKGMLRLTLEQRLSDWIRVEGLSSAIFYFLPSPNALATMKTC